MNRFLLSKTPQVSGALVHLFAATLLVGLLNQGLNLYLAKTLSAADYGNFAAFTALFLIVSLLPAGLQHVASREHPPHKTTTHIIAQRWGLICSGILGVLGIGAWQGGWPIWWVLLLAALMPNYAMLGVQRGQALRNNRYANNLILEHGGKIVITGLLAFVLPLANAAVLGLLLALLLANVGLPTIKDKNPTTHPDANTVKQTWGSLLGFVSQALISNADVLLVRVLFPAETAGLYAIAAMVGRVVFFATSPISTALVPEVAKRQQQGSDSTSLLVAALGWVGLLCAAITTWAFVFPEQIIATLFKPSHLLAAPWLGWYALSSSLFALSSTVVSHGLALGRTQVSIPPFFAAVAQLMLILVFHTSILTVLVVQVLVQSILLIALFILSFANAKESHHGLFSIRRLAK